ncbi:MAG: hypothetical protein HZA93_25285 [Verrucomicrobia bacterium]|nr:hypothetical protein [Verrucomicrobiota bacterium]
MKLTLPRLAAASLALGLSVLTTHAGVTAGMTEGAPALKSVGPLAFGPDGILFAADTKSAAIFAIATGDTKSAPNAAQPLKIEAVNEKIAALLGTTADQILIADLAVNPASRNAYLSVSRGRGPDAVPVIVRARLDGQIEVVSLAKVMFSKVELPDAPVDRVVSQGKRQSNPRQLSITDIAFLDGRVIVAGLANEEFASSLRAITFPFKQAAGGTTVEIYHGAHGQFETRAPVRTFVARNVGGQSQLLAAYTCTPLVEFALSEIQPDAKVKGKTIAELGNGNTPLDMIVYQKNGKDFLLMANTSRGVMKIGTDGMERAQRIESRVSGTKHETFSVEAIADWKGVEQLDRLDAANAVVVRKATNGALNLEALPLP